MKTTENHIASQKGALLVTLIVAMVVIAMAGSAMLYFSSTSSYGEFLANRQERAYYVGESGINYAYNRYIIDGTLLTSATTMTLLNGDKFAVTSEIVSKGSPAEDWLVIKSTGSVESGWLNAKQQVTKEIKKALATGMAPVATDSSGDPLAFDANTDATLDTTWAVVEGTVTINDGDLLFKGTEATINLNPSSVNLCDAWASNSNLLSYYLQVKVQNSSYPKHFLVGLSFRVQNSTVTSNSYGFSFFRYDIDNNCPSSIDWCKNTYGIQRNLKGNSKVYAVLWKRVSDRYTILAYAEMVSSYGVAVNGNLLEWPAMLVRINERSDGKNYIKAYVKAPSVPATGNISWSVSSFKPVEWTATCTLDSCTSVTPFTEVVDGTFLSAGFCSGTTQNRPEIGVHGFYDMECNKCQFFDDFAVSVQGTSGGSTQY